MHLPAESNRPMRFLYEYMAVYAGASAESNSSVQSRKILQNFAEVPLHLPANVTGLCARCPGGFFVYCELSL